MSTEHDDENEDDVLITRIRGLNFTDHLMVRPPQYLEDDQKELLMDVAEEAILGALKKKAWREERHLNAGNVEDHLHLAFPSALVAPRGKYLDKATALAKQAIEEQRYTVVVIDYDPKTREKTPCTETFEPPKPRAARAKK
jgi:hypothetical protein